MTNDLFQAQLPHTLARTDLADLLPGLGEPRRGKVRDVYARGDKLILVTTDRLSAFDRVLTTIPFKGQLLNQLAAFWFEKTRDVCPNHVLEVPHPNVLVGRKCVPLPVEVVVRGYLTGGLWRDYVAGKANAAYGLTLPAGLTRDQAFERPLVTPSTKAEGGAHDAPLTEPQVHVLVPAKIWAEAKKRALALFALGQAWAQTRGLILVDTKYELGLAGGELYAIDEIHTPDSSRYWIAEGSAERQRRGEPQQMLDKENIRQWLIQERGFQGHGEAPTIPDEVRVSLAKIYASAFERITGAAPQLRVGDPAPALARALERLV
jgi:phosphoribosylaminoimidazole-succinocarboxamide synthase